MRRELTEAQKQALIKFCHKYGVEFNVSHYYINPANGNYFPGYAYGWIGGQPHSSLSYRAPKLSTTCYVRVSATGIVECC